MSVAPEKKEKKRQLREGDRIADFTVVKTLGHGGYGDIYLVKSRIHPDYLTRFAMKIEYPNKDNNNARKDNAPSKNQNNQNQNDNSNKNKEKGNDNKSSTNENANNPKDNAENDNDNNNKNAEKLSTSNQEKEVDNNDNKENKDNNKKDENNNNNNKNKIRSPLRKSHLYIERQVLNAVQDSPYFPRYISFGQTSLFRFLVMECFGPSLSAIRHVLLTGKYSLSSSLRIGIQMLRAIHAFHSHNFIHRDIKPSNFLIAPSLSHPIILIDFGLARVINTEKDKVKPNSSGELSNSNANLSSLPSDRLNNSSANLNQNAKAKFGFAGTTKYASINAHENKELGRRDDLFSWFFSLIELAAGSLPWSSLREKDDIYLGKKSADLDAFIAEHSLPKQLCSIRILLESYSRTDEPDYDLIESFLDEAMRHHGCSWDDKYEWQRIDEESLRDLSSIPLKPPKGDRFIPNQRLPEPILPSKKKSRKRKDFSDEDYEVAEIDKITSKSKQRRHTSGILNDNLSKRNRNKTTNTQNRKIESNLQHYSQQVDTQGRSFFNNSDEKERYSHFGSDQLFSNSSGKIPSYRAISSLNRKTAPSPITQVNNKDNNTNNAIEKNTSTSTRRKYVTTTKRHKNQRKRRNSDPRQPPQIKKQSSSNGKLDKKNTENQNNDVNNDDKQEEEGEGVPLHGKGYQAVSTSNSIIFISSAHHKNDNNNDNDNEDDVDDNNSSSNSMYYTYHSYSSGDDDINNFVNNNNSNNNSYYYGNSSNYTDSDSDFSFGEKHKTRNNFKRKNQSCPAMEPVIDRRLNDEKKKNKKNKYCLIQ